MSDLASVQSIHQNLCTNEKNSFINLHKNCLHVTLKAKFKPFKVNSVYLIVYYIRIFMKINSLISPGIFQLISDIIYMYIFTLRVTLFGGYKFGGSKSTITINLYCHYIGDFKIDNLSHLYKQHPPKLLLTNVGKILTIVSNLCYRTIKGNRYSIECQKPNWLFKKRNAGSKQDQSNISCKNQNFNVLTIISYYYVY